MGLKLVQRVAFLPTCRVKRRRSARTSATSDGSVTTTTLRPGEHQLNWSAAELLSQPPHPCDGPLVGLDALQNAHDRASPRDDSGGNRRPARSTSADNALRPVNLAGPATWSPSGFPSRRSSELYPATDGRKRFSALRRRSAVDLTRQEVSDCAIDSFAGPTRRAVGGERGSRSVTSAHPVHATAG